MTNRAAYTIRRYPGWDGVPKLWADLARDGRATPFQTAAFLGTWYATLGKRSGLTPVIMEAIAADGTPVMLLPLVMRRRYGLKILAFPDDGVADNNAIILGPGAPRDPAGFAALWRQMRAALPAADLMIAERQPQRLGDLLNPLLGLAQPQPSPMSAHPLTLDDSWDDYSRSRTTKFRKEQERVWRVFTRTPGARFDMVSDPERALHVLYDMERLQKARMAEIGADYRLDQQAYIDFYRALIPAGLTADALRLGVLSANGETVGALMGVYDGRSVTFVRLAHAGGAWATSSPGRLVIEQTLMGLHAEGIRQFDFSIGDYHYKDNFRVGTVPLAEFALALSWRGRPAVAMLGLRHRLSRSPRLRALVHRMRGQTTQSLARST